MWLQNYSEFPLSLIVHSYDGMSTQMKCSDVSQYIVLRLERVVYTSGSCGGAVKDIGNITFQILCIRLI